MKLCPECGERVHCSTGINKHCWCSSYPPVIPLTSGEKCLCERCLFPVVKTRVLEYVAKVKSGVLPNTAPQYKHYPVIEGLDYFREGDRKVYTEWYRLKQGSCCESNCEYCPY